MNIINKDKYDKSKKDCLKPHVHQASGRLI